MINPQPLVVILALLGLLGLSTIPFTLGVYGFWLFFDRPHAEQRAVGLVLMFGFAGSFYLLLELAGAAWPVLEQLL